MPGRTDEAASDVRMEDDGAPPSHQPQNEEEFENEQQFPEDEDEEDDAEQRVRIVCLQPLFMFAKRKPTQLNDVTNATQKASRFH